MKIQITKTNRLMSLTVLLILVHCSIVTFAQPGAIDPSFTPPVFKNSARIRAIVPLPDGSVFVAGHFNEVNGVARTNLARLKPDGSGTMARILALFLKTGGVKLGSIAPGWAKVTIEQ